jgi:hypothetical protein
MAELGVIKIQTDRILVPVKRDIYQIKPKALKMNLIKLKHYKNILKNGIIIVK